MRASCSVKAVGGSSVLQLASEKVTVFGRCLPAPFHMKHGFLGPLCRSGRTSYGVCCRQEDSACGVGSFNGSSCSNSYFTFIKGLGKLSYGSSGSFVRVVGVVSHSLRLKLSSKGCVRAGAVAPVDPTIATTASPSGIGGTGPCALTRGDFATTRLTF